MSETNNKVANGFRIPVWNGLLDHFGRMKDGIWLFLFCLDKTTKEYTGEDGRRLGKVCGTQPLRDADIAKSIEGCSAKVVRKWRLRLVKEGYLIQKRTPYGHILEVAKSKKWTESDGSSELPKRASHPEKGITQPGRENYPTGPRELPNRAERIARKCKYKEDSSGLYKKGQEEAHAFAFRKPLAKNRTLSLTRSLRELRRIRREDLAPPR